MPHHSRSTTLTPPSLAITLLELREKLPRFHGRECVRRALVLRLWSMVGIKGIPHDRVVRVASAVRGLDVFTTPSCGLRWRLRSTAVVLDESIAHLPAPSNG